MNKLLKHGALNALLLSITFTTTVQAELIPRLNGQAIYDSDRDITFLADGRLALTVPFGLTYTAAHTAVPPLLTDEQLAPGEIDSLFGFMTLDTGLMWLQGMNDANYLGFNDWRLPTTLVPDASCIDTNIGNGVSSNGIPASGFDCLGSELGHLHTEEIGMTSANSWNDGDPEAWALFSNQPGLHLTSTEFAPNDPYIYSIILGFVQAPLSVIAAAFETQTVVTIWPVRDGDVGDYPVSNPGTGATVHIGDLFTLDGSASSDPDGHYPLTYSWSIVSAPAGSAAVLSDPTVVNPSFTADQIGDYVFQLVVNDSLGLAGAPMQVTYSTFNTAPVADAGPDQVVVVSGSTIQLDGSQSYDDDGDSLTAAWGFTAKPTGSNATLSDTASLTPTFVIDAYGDYDLSLTVTDEFGVSSTADTVSIGFANVQPVANPGMDQTGTAGDTFVLDGNSSSDANNDVLSYSWSFTTVPMGSNAVLNNSASAQPSFTADIAGAYISALVVSDGILDSVAETVEVEVTDVQLSVIDVLTQTVHTLRAIPNNRQNFKHRKAKRILIRTLNRAIARINRGNISGHFGPESTLKRVLRRTNGCVNNGSPDRNDWIKKCDDQVEIYNSIMDAINLL